ncbi:MAG: hypothetical protein QOD00_3119 [Blastocatellia bacterium]|nr:hypothetical protein [Blastocatellia bacterium]
MSEEYEDGATPSENVQTATAPRSFSPAEMLKCAACARANPPTRTNCLYCGGALPLATSSAVLQMPPLRPLEKWERGYNTIVAPQQSGQVNEDSLTEMAGLLRLDASHLKRIIETNEALPLCRAATFDEASLVESRLSALGLRALVVSDGDLREEALTPKRTRAVVLTSESLILHPTGGATSRSLSWSEALLLVAGRLMVRQVSSAERQGRRRKKDGSEHEIINASETHADEAVLDIYTASGGWRIAANHFDFSCLGQQKSLIAAENFLTLVSTMRSLASAATYDDSFTRVRHALDLVWKPEQHVESRGVKRERPGRYSKEVLTTSDNEAQFTRYALLRHYLLSRRADVNR